MQIFDVTRTLQPGMATWPGEPGPELTLDKGDGGRSSR